MESQDRADNIRFLTVTSSELTCDGRILCPRRPDMVFGAGLFEIKSCINTGRRGQKVHSDRDQKGTAGNVALLVPNPFPTAFSKLSISLLVPSHQHHDCLFLLSNGRQMQAFVYSVDRICLACLKSCNSEAGHTTTGHDGYFS